MNQNFNDTFRRKKDLFKVLTLQRKSARISYHFIIDGAYLPPIDSITVEFLQDIIAGNKDYVT